MSSIVNRVADGRRLATRRVVMNSPTSIPCVMFRKKTVYANPSTPDEPENGLSFEALSLSQQDEPEYEYEDLGTAFMLIDRFTGGIIHKNNSMVNPADITITAQLEPYNDELSTQAEQIKSIPEWLVQDGDLVGAMIYGETIIWFEVVGIPGQTLASDFGKKYLLNRRDDLAMSPFTEERELRIAMKFLPELLTYKRGESASWEVLLFDENSPMHEGIYIGNGIIVTAEIVDGIGNILANPVVTPDPDQNARRGYVTVSIISDTSAWPLGTATAKFKVFNQAALEKTIELFFTVSDH